MEAGINLRNGTADPRIFQSSASRSQDFKSSAGVFLQAQGEPPKGGTPNGGEDDWRQDAARHVTRDA